MTNIPSLIWNIIAGSPLSADSKSAAETWLSRGELGLVLFGAIIIVGLVGEYCAEKIDEHRKQSWIPPLDKKYWDWKFLFAAVVVLSIIGEFVSDADIWVTSDVIQVLADNAIEGIRRENNNTMNIAKGALDRAANAETRATELLKENIELERALRPREFNQATLANAVSKLPRVPVVIIPFEKEEPKEVASEIVFALTGVRIGNSEAWSVTKAPPDNVEPYGITFEYVKDLGSVANSAAASVSIAICESLKNDGLIVAVRPVPNRPIFLVHSWPPSVPTNAVIVRVGEKLNNFWRNKYLREKGYPEMPESFSGCTPEEFFDWAQKQRQQSPSKPQ